MTTTSVATSATLTSATPNVQTLTTNKPPSVDGAKAPSLTLDGTSKVQSRIPYSATSTSIPVSTYPNVLPISSSAARGVKFLLPSFVTSATGARPKDSYQPFFNPDTTQMTRPTGVTTVTSSTGTRPSVFPNVQSRPFVPQQHCHLSKTLAQTVE